MRSRLFYSSVFNVIAPQAAWVDTFFCFVPLGLVILRFLRRPAVEEHIEEFGFGGQVAESVEKSDEVFKLIESVSSCTTEDRVEYATGFAASSTSEEKPVLATDGSQSQHAFGFVVVNSKSSIVCRGIVRVGRLS